MFVPPENRQPAPLPSDPSPPKRVLTAREQAVLLWLIGVLLVLTFLAPIGGSTVLQALWYLLGR